MTILIIWSSMENNGSHDISTRDLTDSFKESGMRYDSFSMALFPYKPALTEGYWGTPTSTIDWCEENYVISYYFAEIVNSTTNTLFAYLAYMIVSSAIQNGHDMIFSFVGLGMLLVGIGSWMFHMTLWYKYQLLDELPMVYVCWIALGYMFSVARSNTTAVIVHLTTAASLALFTYIYCYVWRDPVLQEVVFGVVNLAIIYKSVSLTYQYVPDAKARKQILTIMGESLAECALAFFLWRVDTDYCSTWIELRHYVGLPLGLLLECHGWWHFFSGLGFYHFIIYMQMTNVWFRHREKDYLLTYMFGMPHQVVLSPVHQD